MDIHLHLCWPKDNLENIRMLEKLEKEKEKEKEEEEEENKKNMNYYTVSIYINLYCIFRFMLEI